MTFLEMEMKELGISDYNNTHNKRSLIRTLKYVPDIVADGKSINTHTHTHTHTQCVAWRHWVSKLLPQKIHLNLQKLSSVEKDCHISLSQGENINQFEVSDICKFAYRVFYRGCPKY